MSSLGTPRAGTVAAAADGSATSVHAAHALHEVPRSTFAAACAIGVKASKPMLDEARETRSVGARAFERRHEARRDSCRGGGGVCAGGGAPTACDLVVAASDVETATGGVATPFGNCACSQAGRCWPWSGAPFFVKAANVHDCDLRSLEARDPQMDELDSHRASLTRRARIMTRAEYLMRG
eukprot:3455916-Pleurochrysis_carterae.AAC.1